MDHEIANWRDRDPFVSPLGEGRERADAERFGRGFPGNRAIAANYSPSDPGDHRCELSDRREGRIRCLRIQR